MKIIFATQNNGKIIEIKKILEPPHFEVISLSEAGIDMEIEEDGATFEENAVKKATEIAEYILKRDGITGTYIMADDSGLEIDCLDKQPGVQSARYLGHDTPYDVKNKKILDSIKEVSGSGRSARFVCAIACISDRDCADGSKAMITRDTIEGMIAYEPSGANGFGYDPIFYVEEYRMTLAEMDVSDKNKISHRGKALKLMKEKLGIRD